FRDATERVPLPTHRIEGPFEYVRGSLPVKNMHTLRPFCVPALDDYRNLNSVNADCLISPWQSSKFTAIKAILRKFLNQIRQQLPCRAGISIPDGRNS